MRLSIIIFAAVASVVFGRCPTLYRASSPVSTQIDNFMKWYGGVGSPIAAKFTCIAGCRWTAERNYMNAANVTLSVVNSCNPSVSTCTGKDSGIVVTANGTLPPESLLLLAGPVLMADAHRIALWPRIGAPIMNYLSAFNLCTHAAANSHLRLYHYRA